MKGEKFMNEYVHGIEISNVLKIYDSFGSSSRCSLEIEYKDGNKETLTFITKDNSSFNERRKVRRELLEAYNEYNNIQETFLLENEAYANINGEIIHFGTRCKTILDDYVLLTLKEIDNLRKEFKIKDEGWRHLAAITMLTIKGNKVIGSVPKRYIEQLEYMGYDTNVLEYELEE